MSPDHVTMFSMVAIMVMLYICEKYYEIKLDPEFPPVLIKIKNVVLNFFLIFITFVLASKLL